LGGPSSEPDLYEIVGGKIQEKVMGVKQAGFASYLMLLLGPYVASQKLGQVFTELLFHLADGQPERRPDLAYVSEETWPSSRPLPDEAAWAVVPDLMVEVISPSNRFGEVTRKVEEYFNVGVKQVWLIDLEVNQLMIYTSMTQVRILTRRDQVENNPLFPDFTLPLAQLFARVSP
jgi:Uma2 family endonuclease